MAEAVKRKLVLIYYCRPHPSPLPDQQEEKRGYLDVEWGLFAGFALIKFAVIRLEILSE